MQSVDHPVIGFRTWKYGGPGKDLKSVAQTHRWTKRIEARCLRPIHLHRGHAPAEGCDCGLYAFHDLPDAITYRTALDVTDVVGIVRGWGSLRVHQDGWRAQYAEILAIVEPPIQDVRIPSQATIVAAKHKRALAAAHEAGRHYGVPVIPAQGATAMACEFGSFVPVDLRPTSSIFAMLRSMSPAEEMVSVVVVLAPLIIGTLSWAAASALFNRWRRRRRVDA